VDHLKDNWLGSRLQIAHPAVVASLANPLQLKGVDFKTIPHLPTGAVMMEPEKRR
jgi:hypothetical protein